MKERGTRTEKGRHGETMGGKMKGERQRNEEMVKRNEEGRERGRGEEWGMKERRGRGVKGGG